MKSFFEEYGFVILAAIVVILLIAMCTPIGNLVKSQITGIVDSFANKTNTKLNAVDASENTAYLRYEGSEDNMEIKLDVSSANSTDEFKYIVHYTSGGTAAATNETGFKSGDSDDKNTAGTMSISDLSLSFDTGSTVQVEVKNVGTGEVFYSNALTVKKLTVKKLELDN